MHPYSSNLTEYKRVPLYIAIVSYFVTWLLAAMLSRLAWRLPLWIEVPGFFTLYSLGYEWFRRHLWRLKPIRLLCGVRTPIIDGTWKGIVTTSFDAHAQQHSVTVNIKQDWTACMVQLKSDYSTSTSLGGSMIVYVETALTYEYFNEPVPGADPRMHAHRGTARLILGGDGNSLEGEYYSGRDRENQGILKLIRQES